MTVHLVSIDGSTCAQKAVELALRTMNMELDTIHLVSIVQKVVTIPPAAMDVPFYPANMSVDVSATKARENQAIKLLQAYKNFYCGLDGKSKVVVPADRFHTAVLEGTDTAQDVMLKYMENNPTDILYVGCRGLGAFKRMVLGSFSTYMINHAPCPVFVVHDHKDGEYPKEDEPLDRLVCVDGSPESDKAFHIALKTMKKKDTLHVMVGVPREVVVSGAMALPFAFATTAADSVAVANYEKGLVENARKLLDSYAEQCKAADISYKTEILTSDDVRDSIVDYIKDRKIAALYVGSRRRGAVKRFFLGSFSNYMLHHVDCNVLVANHEEGDKKQ
eukprot:TRINITY_DN7_c0_g1_i1.p1 TRINITY_DN7_c0_g1~~TRINITY_DN7_c0_g1_i1.p1  ORF type:complete len:333 (-),score=110.20 TRINITY_DN7_c0_g1_i1:1151-2149(-)